ncbi:hypothetical protein [Paraburkholderia hospita]|uniref:hypothetical protein n=1 Tax=Paraburkholderia hospita TaxID=169430 RepID=UPI000271BFE2|nr:hypothetical protein [Paraburkholderia hospita]EUC21467.1 hypothetical protein PMI06_009183 [Burkholderia sp. BT03]SKC95331.1 hypothetical protein SAMN06266956_6902 [Paraburkholderia hospita]
MFMLVEAEIVDDLRINVEWPLVAGLGTFDSPKVVTKIDSHIPEWHPLLNAATGSYVNSDPPENSRVGDNQIRARGPRRRVS